MQDVFSVIALHSVSLAGLNLNIQLRGLYFNMRNKGNFFCKLSQTYICLMDHSAARY